MKFITKINWNLIFGPIFWEPVVESTNRSPRWPFVLRKLIFFKHNGKVDFFSYWNFFILFQNWVFLTASENRCDSSTDFSSSLSMTNWTFDQTSVLFSGRSSNTYTYILVFSFHKILFPILRYHSYFWFISLFYRILVNTGFVNFWNVCHFFIKRLTNFSFRLIKWGKCDQKYSWGNINITQGWGRQLTQCEFNFFKKFNTKIPFLKLGFLQDLASSCSQVVSFQDP